MEELKPLNAEIVSSIRAARQKLSVDHSKENMQQDSFMESHLSQQLYRAGNTLVDKTINVQIASTQSLKQKIELLEGEKQQLASELSNCRKVQQHEVDALKHQLSRYIEKEFEQTLDTNLGGIQQIKAQLTASCERLSKKDLELQHYLEKYRQMEQLTVQLKDNCGRLQSQLDQTVKEKDRHIELNIEDKLRYEEELKQSRSDADRKQQIIKKLEQEGLSLRKELNQLQAQQRCSRNTESYEKKLKEEYEFEIKELNQRYSVKVAKQEKEMQLLRKTIEKLKNKHNESDAVALANSEREVEHLKERIVDLETRLSIKSIDAERLTTKIEQLTKTLQERQAELKKQEQTIQKKEDIEKNLLTKLAKSGLEPKEAKQPPRSKLKEFEFSAKFFSGVVESDTPTFTQHKSEARPPKVPKQQEKSEQENEPIRTLPDRAYNSDHADNTSLKSDRIGRIAKEERALADLKSTYRKAQCADMSLTQIMQEIRRKSDKINELRQTGSKV